MGFQMLALRNPDKYVTASAFAPICNPSKCPWGTKAFGGCAECISLMGRPFDILCMSPCVQVSGRRRGRVGAVRVCCRDLHSRLVWGVLAIAFANWGHRYDPTELVRANTHGRQMNLLIDQARHGIGHVHFPMGGGHAARGAPRCAERLAWPIGICILPMRLVAGCVRARVCVWASAPPRIRRVHFISRSRGACRFAVYMSNGAFMREMHI